MNSPHTLSAFDAELQKVGELLLTMGGRVEQSIIQASQALAQRDEELAAQVVEADKDIDALEDEINHAVVRTLARFQPQANDLRLVISVMKMAADLERLGDYAKNMAKRVAILSASPPVEGAGAAIQRQARQVGLMLKDMLDAFARRDASLAQDVIARDVEIDQMTNALFREYITHMMEDPRNITSCLHYTFIAKNVERMGDLVTNAAEHVVFIAVGERPGHREKGASTATLDVPAQGAAT